MTYQQIYGEKSEGEVIAKMRLEGLEFPRQMVEGMSLNPFFLAGYKFELKDHPRTDANRSYAFYEVIHKADWAPEEEEMLYSNQFQAFPSTGAFRPPLLTPKPRIYGTQTAKVTGKKDEEIYTDDYGRIKVKFRWDPSQKEDDTTSGWIRVGEECSGKGWGTLFTPRVGMEVIVSFIDGDPDNPIVIGSVYNGENKPPYLPTEKEMWTIQDQSTPKGTGSNKFRFNSKLGKEEVYIHAEKDFKVDVKNDLTEKITNHHTITIDEKDGSLKILKGNYIIDVLKGNITITCPTGNVNFKAKNMTITCDDTFKVEAKKIDMTAMTTMNIKGTTGFRAETNGKAELSGTSAEVKGTASAELKGATVKVKGTASAKISAAIVDVDGTASAKISAAIVRLN